MTKTASQPYQRREFKGSGGIQLVADIAGDLSAATVILMHGGGQTRHSWGGATRALAETGYHVVNMDGRGHGESAWSADGNYSIQARSEDLQAVLTEIEGPCALVGASMGGMAALYTTCTADRRNIKALVLVDIVPKPSAHGVKRIQEFMHKHLDGFDSIEEAIAAVAAYNPDRQRAPDPVGMRKNLRTAADGRLKWHWDPSMLSLDAWTESAALMAVLDRAARVPPIPTLLIRGLKSDVVVDDGIAALREKIPDLVVVDVADAGHMVAGDKNDLFNTGVVEFLRKHMPP